ncbi:hypothetical protein BU26DRAFT_48895 [Trematosphaeria pertusa]|uniref:RRM domain-containing protein n=1 Tax=Trematosphaeria pertusa TaxID=390896 RepID=A0A6A6I8M0_9PLEO|nr:uncharacterized protein BU26DRAFT_48895 [Trematosphaeria pertusa]KAF2246559.1 hypothetical protein BU26DRAFT_48895 [Trematosphaeria pertusa]
MASEKPSKAKKQKTAPTTVAEFTILPLTLPALPGLPDAYADAKHYLYVKQHEPKHSTPGHDRSLFIANVPIDASETGIRALFAEQLGGSRVERVEFDSAIPALTAHKRFQDASDAKAEGKEKRGKKRKRDADVVAEGVVEDEESALPRIWSSELRKGGSGAVVVFVDRKSMRGALKEVQRAVKEGREIVWKGGEGLGVERYKSHLTLRYPPPAVLQTSVNAYLTQFTALENKRNKIRKHARSEPDEEGFITVVRGGGRNVRLEDAEKKKAELEERRKKNGIKDDFYRFQNRERRKEEELRLRKGFERDRKRVLEMRERRGRVVPES